MPRKVRSTDSGAILPTALGLGHPDVSDEIQTIRPVRVKADDGTIAP